MNRAETEKKLDDIKAMANGPEKAYQMFVFAEYLRYIDITRTGGVIHKGWVHTVHEYLRGIPARLGGACSRCARVALDMIQRNRGIIASKWDGHEFEFSDGDLALVGRDALPCILANGTWSSLNYSDKSWSANEAELFSSKGYKLNVKPVEDHEEDGGGKSPEDITKVGSFQVGDEFEYLEKGQDPKPAVVVGFPNFHRVTIEVDGEAKEVTYRALQKMVGGTKRGEAPTGSEEEEE